MMIKISEENVHPEQRQRFFNGQHDEKFGSKPLKIEILTILAPDLKSRCFVEVR
jgi:hypothetical protein